MHSSSVLSLSPSFDSYSSGKLAQIAARVVEEFRAESDSQFDDVFGLTNEHESNDIDQEQPGVQEQEGTKSYEDDDDDDFEFPCVCADPTSADEIFYNGQIRPVFPIFGRDLLFSDVENCKGEVNSSKPPTPSPIRIPLGKLMSEDRDPPSCSSSEADELDGVPAGTYCVWKPKSDASAVAESPERCKKSSSTGSSKRWKFRDLLYRSNSDGKDTFVFLAPSNANSRKKKNDKASERATEVKVAGKVIPTVARGVAAVQEGDRRRLLMPYRQDLVGFFANVNGLSRNLHPF
ncbi:unnamed protein product [Camellia sinensis]